MGTQKILWEGVLIGQTPTKMPPTLGPMHLFGFPLTCRRKRLSKDVLRTVLLLLLATMWCLCTVSIYNPKGRKAA